MIDLQLKMCLAILPATKFETAFTVLASGATEMTASCLCSTSGSPGVAKVCRFDPSSFLTGICGEKNPLELLLLACGVLGRPGGFSMTLHFGSNFVHISYVFQLFWRSSPNSQSVNGT